MTELELYNEFAEAARLNKMHDPWRKRREAEMELAYFEIISCAYPNWWYSSFAGVEFLGLIRWDNWYFESHGIKKIKEVVAVAMIRKVYMNSGRTLKPEDLIML